MNDAHNVRGAGNQRVGFKFAAGCDRFARLSAAVRGLRRKGGSLTCTSF
jgi:hypothetical protein